MAYKVEVYLPGDEDVVEVTADYVTFVNDKTFGVPAIACRSDEKTLDGVQAQPGETVAFVNAAVTPFFTITPTV